MPALVSERDFRPLKGKIPQSRRCSSEEGTSTKLYLGEGRKVPLNRTVSFEGQGGKSPDVVRRRRYFLAEAEIGRPKPKRQSNQGPSLDFRGSPLHQQQRTRILRTSSSIFDLMITVQSTEHDFASRPSVSQSGNHLDKTEEEGRKIADSDSESETFEARCKIKGNHITDFGKYCMNLGKLHMGTREWEAAITLFEKAALHYKRDLGADHLRGACPEQKLAEAHQSLAKETKDLNVRYSILTKAKEHAGRALAIRKKARQCFPSHALTKETQVLVDQLANSMHACSELLSASDLGW